MNEDKFNFGVFTFVAVPAKTEKEIKMRCYKCWFYGSFCHDKQEAGIIPQCEAYRRKDGNFVFFKRKE